MEKRGFNCASIAILIITLFSLTCRNDKKTTYPVDDGSSQTVIGPGGGSVADSYGASITVPAGAVSSNMKINVRTIHADSIPAELQSAVVGNMIECLPHGATFLKPVTLVMPVTSGKTYEAGDTANVFFFNPDSSVWEMTDIPAVVTADGGHFQASVTHFTNFGTNTTGGHSGGGFFEPVKNATRTHLTNYARMWADRFMQDRGGLNSKTGYADCCMDLAKAEFSFRFQSELYSDTYEFTYGKSEDCDRTESVHYSEGDYDPNTGSGYNMRINVQICWVVCDPDMQFSVSPDHFEVPDDKGKTASITASVTCGSGGGSAFGGQSVKFVIVSGPGRVDPQMAQTDGSGTATGTYTVEQKGTASIRAEVQTCSAISPVITMQTAQVVVDTVIADRIDAVININHGGGDMPWTFHDLIHIINYLQVDDQNVSITGGDGLQGVTCTATATECSIRNIGAPGFAASGKVTRNGDALYVELNPTVPINFTYYCDFGDDDIINQPVPAYGFMVSSIIAKYVKGTLQMADGAVVSGSGAESFGEDLPVSYDWKLEFHVKKQQ